MNEYKTKDEIYNEVIQILDIIEITIVDEKQFKYIRKKLLDIANDVLRFGE
jgi:SepF-like predicted cell division protein (DUF552 family)